MTLPKIVTESRLYRILEGDKDLLWPLVEMRSVVEALANTTVRTVPAFTDHTIRHMDALWQVSDQILSESEAQNLTSAEAFLLGSAFYLHDIGMAYAATSEGISKLQDSQAYKNFLNKFPEEERKEESIKSRAICFAVRLIHAGAAKELAISPIPGTKEQYLFNSVEFREAWGSTCGEIAASHHWSISELEKYFWHQGNAPLPGGRTGDLLYVASCLRLIDYAHINRDRASLTDRAFRGELEPDSLMHWLAQENIDGPARFGDDLIYRAAKPIIDVEAWWLFYGMLNGLDAEIRSVRRLLNRRGSEFKKLALSGVRGAASPEEAASYIPTSGFLPLEVDLRTGSIDKLVEILAGETLYGPNPIAAVRELIQNARDAVILKSITATSELEKAALSLPIKISLNTTATPPMLQITDYGVGMNKSVMTDYLIAIASDYWTSQYAIDFPKAVEKGFKSAGKFGVGFLSAFMLGAEITVESSRAGEDRYQLKLKGAGRRGELRLIEPIPGSGTTIKINLNKNILEKIQPLEKLVGFYAPMIPHQIYVEVDGAATILALNWIKALPLEDFKNWVINAIVNFRDDRDGWPPVTLIGTIGFIKHPPDLHRRNDFDWLAGCPEYNSDNGRLISSSLGRSVLSFRGITVQIISTPGYMGIIDVDSATLEVNRNKAMSSNFTEIIAKARNAFIPKIVENLNALSQSKLVIDNFSFIGSMIAFYGKEVVLESNVPWINKLSFPGEVDLISSSTFLKDIADRKDIFVVFNTGPWTAMRKWAKTKHENDEFAILIDDAGLNTPNYTSSREKEIKGTIKEIWDGASSNAFFSCLMHLVAQAWQVSMESLINQGGWTHEDAMIYGRWHRP